MLIISFYGGDKFYYECAEKAISKLNNLKSNFYIEEIQTKSDWETITKFKPTFIKNQLLKFKSPVLWFDIDSIINKIPEQPRCDICGVRTKFRVPNIVDVNVESYLIYFNYNQPTMDFINNWQENCIKENIPSTDHLFFAIEWNNNNNIHKEYFRDNVKKEYIILGKSNTIDKHNCMKRINNSRI